MFYHMNEFFGILYLFNRLVDFWEAYEVLYLGYLLSNIRLTY